MEDATSVLYSSYIGFLLSMVEQAHAGRNKECTCSASRSEWGLESPTQNAAKYEASIDHHLDYTENHRHDRLKD